MLFFTVVALPSVICGVAAALVWLPSRTTGARRVPASPAAHRPPPATRRPDSVPTPWSTPHAGWLVRLDVGLAWFAALATLILVPTDVAAALSQQDPGPLAVWWRAAYWCGCCSELCGPLGCGCMLFAAIGALDTKQPSAAIGGVTCSIALLPGPSPTLHTPTRSCHCHRHLLPLQVWLLGAGVGAAAPHGV